MTISKIIGTILLSNWITFANCAKFVAEGTTAPYDGILFTMDEEIKLRVNNEKLIKLEQLEVLHDKKSQIDEQRIASYKEYVEDTRTIGSYSKSTYFVLGFLSTSLMFYATSKVIENSK